VFQTSEHTPLIPAQAGIQNLAKELDPRFRGDERLAVPTTSASVCANTIPPDAYLTIL
jgi:hypothetical protein